MESASWEALPPRTRKPGKRAVAAENRKHADNEGDDGNQAKKAKTFQENVQERAEKSANNSYANATLEGKDGCAGEFYEYLDHTADVQVSLV